MIKHHRDIDGRFFRVMDADTGVEIPRVVWANDETGEYHQHVIDEHGQLVMVRDEYGEAMAVKCETKYGHIRLVDIREAAQ